MKLPIVEGRPEPGHYWLWDPEYSEWNMVRVYGRCLMHLGSGVTTWLDDEPPGAVFVGPIPEPEQP